MQIKRKIILLALFLLAFFAFPSKAKAIEEPLKVPNNKFGIHIIDENDLEDAAKLVNSSGGDWGYITLVIREDERDVKRWQKVFDKMRELHLIPIVRIATKQVGENWEKPWKDEIPGWISFLNELNWVVKNKYIVVGNEPNHATEWGGEINPTEYANYLKKFSHDLKSLSQDFYILNAGFDASAPDNKVHISEEAFIKKMLEEDPHIFDYIDGWASHSYPNPGFSGSADDIGKGTVRTFEWERDLLKSLGINRDFDIFITETGWAHNGGEDTLLKDESYVSDSFKKAFNDVWNDQKIVAVTPFLLNYQAPPFNSFSWKKADGSFYKFYSEIQSLPKIKGDPKQINSAKIYMILLPEKIFRKDNLFGITYLKNTGQVIWKKGKRYKVDGEGISLEIEVPILYTLKPRDSGFVFYKVINQ